MHDEIERAPLLADHLEHALNARQIFDVGLDDDLGTDAFSERQGTAAEGATLIGECKFGAVAMQHAGDAPGDRAIIGDAHHQSPLPGHQRRGFSDISCCCHVGYSVVG